MITRKLTIKLKFSEGRALLRGLETGPLSALRLQSLFQYTVPPRPPKRPRLAIKDRTEKVESPQGADSAVGERSGSEDGSKPKDSAVSATEANASKSTERELPFVPPPTK